VIPLDRNAVPPVSPLRYVFLDTETTGLDPRRHEVWDLALIVRDPDGLDLEMQNYVDVEHLDRADPAALAVGRFWEQHPDPMRSDLLRGKASPARPRWEVAEHLHYLLRDAVLIGFNPSFDAAFLSAMLRAEHLPEQPWKYRTVDVTTMLGGALGQPPPWSTNELLTKYDITVPPGHRHTAIGDARAARDLFDAWWDGSS
jgi:DNA polymerase III epsilon subunit-like protein